MEIESIYSPESFDINWREEYPFPDVPSYEQEKILSSDDTDVSSGDRISRIYEQFEKYSTNWFMFRESCELISKKFSKTLGMNLTADAYGSLVFQQADGRFMAERPYKNVSDEASNVIAFKDYLDSLNIPYLYVAIPSPVAPETEPGLASEGYLEYSNQMADELLFDLSKENIAYLDLRSSLVSENISWTDVFYQSDHHWKPEYGLWAAEKISNEINKLGSYDTNDQIFNPENYKKYRSKQVYMGGYGLSVTSVYADKDDMELWIPEFDTDFRKTVPDEGLSLSGSFEEVMYDKTVWPSYNVWNHGITAIKTYQNKDSNAARAKILCLTESYSDVIMPFLACAYEEMDEIDLRCFSGSLESYIEENTPDMVVTLYSAYDFNNGSAAVLYEFQ